jgi:hypothetical protein
MPVISQGWDPSAPMPCRGGWIAVATLLLIACSGFFIAALWMDLMFDASCMAADIFEVWQSGVRES